MSALTSYGHTSASVEGPGWPSRPGELPRLPISKGLPSSLVQLRTAVWTGVTRDTMPGADISHRYSITLLAVAIAPPNHAPRRCQPGGRNKNHSPNPIERDSV